MSLWFKTINSAVGSRMVSIIDVCGLNTVVTADDRKICHQSINISQEVALRFLPSRHESPITTGYWRKTWPTGSITLLCVHPHTHISKYLYLQIHHHLFKSTMNGLRRQVESLWSPRDRKCHFYFPVLRKGCGFKYRSKFFVGYYLISHMILSHTVEVKITFNSEQFAELKALFMRIFV